MRRSITSPRSSLMRTCLLAFALLSTFAPRASADVLEYGDENLLNTGTYPSDPKAGATLQGLAPGVVTLATDVFGHGFPFTPAAGAFPGTDQIYVGSVQTGAHDGYSVAGARINGPQILTMDYSSLVTVGQSVTTFTLGIATDDFQFPAFGQPFIASINGIVNTALTNTLNSVDDGGPVERFLTIGIDPATLLGTNILTLTIDEGGDGGDGWAVDFLTVGVTTSAVPEPASLVSLGLGSLGVFLCRRRSRRSAQGSA
jgi:PEP-CTERM motif